MNPKKVSHYDEQLHSIKLWFTSEATYLSLRQLSSLIHLHLAISLLLDLSPLLSAPVSPPSLHNFSVHCGTLPSIRGGAITLPKPCWHIFLRWQFHSPQTNMLMSLLDCFGHHNILGFLARKCHHLDALCARKHKIQLTLRRWRRGGFWSDTQ